MRTARLGNWLYSRASILLWVGLIGNFKGVLLWQQDSVTACDALPSELALRGNVVVERAQDGC